MEIQNQDKLKLIEFFGFLLDEEIDKPLGEMNSEAVDNYLKILHNLYDIHIEPSQEFINEQVRKIFHPEEFAVPEAVKTNKKYFNKKKVWLVAACIAILVALFSIISVANDWNVFDFLSEKFGSVHSVPIGKEQEFNGVSVFVNGKTTTYSNIEDALKTEELEVLYPVFLPDEISVNEIIVSKENAKEKIFFTFNDIDLYINILFDTQISEEIKNGATQKITINSIECYICEMPDISSVQIEFEYKGNYYMFSHTDKNFLVDMIGNLEEINNEN